VIHGAFSGPDKIVCTFEDNTCSLHDDLTLKELFDVVKSTVGKWDNTLNIGEHLIVDESYINHLSYRYSLQHAINYGHYCLT